MRLAENRPEPPLSASRRSLEVIYKPLQSRKLRTEKYKTPLIQVQRHYALSAYLRQRFGRRVRKVPLDAGFSCPNRDGTLSVGGCSFCNELGSGTGLLARGEDLRDQWDAWRARMNPEARADVGFMAYLQSYSNTHGSPGEVARVLGAVAALPDLAGVCVGTRPDCLDEARVRILAALPVRELWIDLGLQSADDAVLERVNRGHTAADFARAARLCARHGLKVCAHLIAGLPGDSDAGFLRSVDFASALPVRGVKLHNLYVCKGTALAGAWERGELTPLTREGYTALICEALTRLRPDLVVHRLASDPGPDELLAPDWAAHKRAVLNDIAARMARLDLWQGKALDPQAPLPLWFDPAARPPFD